MHHFKGARENRPPGVLTTKSLSLWMTVCITVKITKNIIVPSSTKCLVYLGGSQNILNSQIYCSSLREYELKTPISVSCYVDKFLFQ